MPKTCCEGDCKKQSNYNFEGNKNALYCNSHKQEGMVDIKNKRCCEEGCKTRPYYNFEGNKNALYCNSHKQEGMIDVKHETCCEEGCKTLPTYNFEGKTPLYCNSHKKEGMIDVKHERCCEGHCKTLPTYNFEGKKPLYCNSHKQEGMINVISKRCKTYLCDIRPSKKYRNYCLRCFMYTFPEEPITRNYKTKEFAVVEYVKQKHSEYNWISDKIISGGCSRRRPDLLLELEEQIIIIEIDENQHIDYDCSCENKRIMELSEDVGHKSIIFIRFNPDEYKNNNENITSCWGTNGNGLCVIKKNKVKEWQERLDMLSSNIYYWINNNTNKTVEIIQLFYDRKHL
jgi:hypothetical protein